MGTFVLFIVGTGSGATEHGVDAEVFGKYLTGWGYTRRGMK